MLGRAYIFDTIGLEIRSPEGCYTLSPVSDSYEYCVLCNFLGITERLVSSLVCP